MISLSDLKCAEVCQGVRVDAKLGYFGQMYIVKLDTFHRFPVWVGVVEGENHYSPNRVLHIVFMRYSTSILKYMFILNDYIQD